MVYCAKCGAQNEENASHCVNCGEPLESQQMSDFKVVTTPSISGYKITKVIGIVNGLSPRTRGIGGVIKGMIQSIGGGEITAFASEIEKARVEAISRAIQQARRRGANAIVGLDMETSDMGGSDSFITLISATGTAVIVEPE
jgi:uncharacterized protein YbjQ (UPF0145 family)